MQYNPIQAIRTVNIPWFHEAFAHLSRSVISVIPQNLTVPEQLRTEKYFAIAPVYAAAATINSVL
jgi:hypothetical protein